MQTAGARALRAPWFKSRHHPTGRVAYDAPSDLLADAGRPRIVAKRSGATDQRPGLRGADDEIVKVAAHLESS